MPEKPLFWLPIDPAAWVNPRAGEIRIGESIQVLSNLDASALPLGRFAIVGVPESIGPRANLGQGGAELGFAAFLQQFLNMQDSGRIAIDQVVLAGQVDCTDLQQQSLALDAGNAKDLKHLRELCAELDKRVAAVTEILFRQGYQVILIGGGHNNALPLLQSLAITSEQFVGAVNLDPHADFRPLEGRHSGNGFSYAFEKGFLKHYHVVALHPAKNSRATLDQLDDAGATYTSVQDMVGMKMHRVLQTIQNQVITWRVPFGIELDVDSIMQAPASAFNYSGVSLADAMVFIRDLAKLRESRYLHLAEAAPACHPMGIAAGNKAAGQILSELVFTYIESHAE
ncbi:arginase [Aliidiomarina shirensis]|uniref:Arginase n=1 Tax=Aliidiomarina shirensis TaxID=1048642 RepID=A0A432WT88_9GAMM|nr:formimidoylglutamase [Aliidiomarina shirensis]RUO36958.1 arginase [Aliidiomarina shirensis]